MGYYLQRTRRGGVLTVRGMYLHSHRLGLSGQCDVVEFRCFLYSRANLHDRLQ